MVDEPPRIIAESYGTNDLDKVYFAGKDARLECRIAIDMGSRNGQWAGKTRESVRTMSIVISEDSTVCILGYSSGPWEVSIFQEDEET